MAFSTTHVRTPCPPAVLPLGPRWVRPTRHRWVCPRASHAPGSHSTATPALNGVALWTCLGLG
jgi:hypothetical protein